VRAKLDEHFPGIVNDFTIPFAEFVDVWQIDYPGGTGFTSGEAWADRVKNKLVKPQEGKAKEGETEEGKEHESWHVQEVRAKLSDVTVLDGGAIITGQGWTTRGCKLVVFEIMNGTNRA